MTLHIEPSYRGRGFGKQLMKLVEQEAKQAGASRIRLHVFQCNEVAQKLYLSMGFKVSSLEMIKEISVYQQVHQTDS